MRRPTHNMTRTPVFKTSILGRTNSLEWASILFIHERINHNCIMCAYLEDLPATYFDVSQDDMLKTIDLVKNDNNYIYVYLLM